MNKNKIDNILKLSAEKFNVDYKDLLENFRYKEIVSARNIAIYILRLYGESYIKIGRTFNKDHTSAIYACKAVKKNEELLEMAIKIKERIDSFDRAGNMQMQSIWGKWSSLYSEYEAKCQVCGLEDIVEVHHIIPKKNGGADTPENLLILCPNHHVMLHLGLIKINNIPKKEHV